MGLGGQYAPGLVQGLCARWEDARKFNVLPLDDRTIERGQGPIGRTNPVVYAVAEGLEIGSDTGTPVWPGYASPFLFTGRLIEVSLNTAGQLTIDHDAEERIARYRQ